MGGVQKRAREREGAGGRWEVARPRKGGDLWVSGGVGLGVPGDKIGRRDPLGVGEQN